MRNLLSDQKVFDLIEGVYAAGCDPSLWPKFVEEVHLALPGTGFSTLLALGKTTLSSQSAVRGIPDECVASYFAHYQFMNPYNSLFERFPKGEVQRLSQLVSLNEIKKHVFYHEWLKPAGNFTHAAGITLLRDDTRLLRMSLDLPEAMGHLEAAAGAFLARLGPHIRRAFEVNEQLHTAAVTRQNFRSIIDAIDGAAIVVSGSGCALGLNQEAETLAREGGLIRVRGDGKLSFNRSEYDEMYRRALASVSDPSRDLSQSVFRVRTAQLEDGTVVVLPLKPQLSTMALQPVGTTALVVIKKLSNRRLPPTKLLQDLYGLTSTEAKVASMLAAGSDATEIADVHSVSRVTVRNQVAAVMGKMGVRRQAELAALVGALAPTLGLSK